jgi:hypothetical protein
MKIRVLQSATVAMILATSGETAQQEIIHCYN